MDRFTAKVSDLLKKLTGISTPIGGISWEPGESEAVVARRVVAFLEDRRALTQPFAPLPKDVLIGTQSCEHCVASVFRTREYLTQEIGRLQNSSQLDAHLRAIRSACLDFLDAVGPQPLMPASFLFYTELAKLRDTVKEHLLKITQQFDIKVEDKVRHFLTGELSGVLPREESFPDEELPNKPDAGDG